MANELHILLVLVPFNNSNVFFFHPMLREFGRLDDDDNRSLSLEKLTEGLRNFQAGLTNEVGITCS